MKTYNYSFKNEKFTTTIDFDIFKDKQNILIQIFSGENKDTLQYLVDLFKEELPQAICIGTTTDGEIKNKNISTHQTVISISVFEKTTIKAKCIQNGDSFQNGYNIAKDLVTDNTKLIISFIDGTTSNGEEFLKGIEKFDNSIIVAGGMAGDNGNFEQTYISCSNNLINCGAVAVSLNSDVLEVINDYKFDWFPIGIEHTIDKIEGNRIYEISGMKATDFYEKYLGSSALHTQFPLITNKNGLPVARALLTTYSDGSLLCAGNLNQGDRVKLGFANAELIMKEPLKYLQNINNYKAETFFIYSCMARRRYLQDLIEVEIQPFSNIAPTAGFFTYAEFYHNNGHNELMNQTITLVGLSENPTKKATKPIRNDVAHHQSSYAKTVQALTNLIKQSTKDYDEQSKQLEQQIVYSENLIKNQKTFLKHAVHETNTPLAVMMSNIELFEMKNSKNEYIDNIEIAMKSLISIYEDLSYLVKKDHIDYPVQKIEVVDFIRSRVFFFETLANQKNSQFIIDINQSEILMFLKRDKLQRIIDNNLSNAIKYSYENANIYVSIIKISGGFQFVVSSHSSKIQDPEQIFQEYYREEKSKDGFGLGLNLVKRICEEENVTIEVQSDEEETTFTYTFNQGGIE